METNTASKYTTSFGMSLALCAVLNALLVIAKEKCASVAAWMQKVTGHHWITHVVLLLAFFAFFGWCFSLARSGQGPNLTIHRLTNIVAAGVVAGVLIVLGFYLIAD